MIPGLCVEIRHDTRGPGRGGGNKTDFAMEYCFHQKHYLYFNGIGKITQQSLGRKQQRKETNNETFGLSFAL